MSEQVLAIAFVVESSLPVAQQWRQVSEYCSFILKRLNDFHTGFSIKMAFVTYGAADTIPSPILCKRFFVDQKAVYKEMAEDLSRLGIGTINPGGSKGMAALEGFVAALELFDVLKDGGSIRSYTCHILHIAASSPDASRRPCWNDSSFLDDVDWDTLPLEIKKRNIQYSSINLSPNLSCFPELHAASITGGSSPWFTVRPPHVLFLAGFVAPPQNKSHSVKRTNEATNVTDSKRPRLQPNNAESSSQASVKDNLNQPQTIKAPQIQPSGLLPSNGQQIVDRLRTMTQSMRKLESAIEIAKSEGKADLAEAMQQEYIQKKESQSKWVQMMGQQLVALKQAHSQSSNPSQAQPQNDTITNPISSTTNSLSSGEVPSSSLGSTDMRNISQAQHSRSSSETNFLNSGSANLPVNFSSPIQKMLEQQQLQRMRSQLPSNQTIGGTPNALASVSQVSQPTDSLPSRFTTIPAPNQQHQSEQTKYVPVWSGSLVWSGVGTTGKKEIRTFVVASTLPGNVSECRADTWPSALTLVPTKDFAGPSPELQMWIKRNKGALCLIQRQNHIPDAKTNDYNFHSLVQLLTMRKLLATAAWTTPSGSQSKNVLLFPLSASQLAGAFFPLTGLPELQKPMMVAQPQQFIDQEQRNMVLAHYLQRQRQQQTSIPQQPQVSRGQDVSGPVPFNLNQVNIGEILTAPQTSSMAINAPQLSSTPHPPHARPSPTHVGGGVSYEILQSFMHRNADTNASPQS